MNGDKLLKTMPILQNQVDALLEFDCSATVSVAMVIEVNWNIYKHIHVRI